MRNIKMTIQYDGGAYHGWQIQKNAVSVQEKLTSAVCGIINEKTNIIGCGRTDAGVHALKYVASFFTSSSIDCASLVKAVNAALPEDIACLSCEDAPSDFHAANSARAKTYSYNIWNSGVKNAFYGRYSWQYKYPLDCGAMRDAARFFLGEHDFVGFAAAGFTVKTTVRTISALEIEKRGDLIEIEITGNGFLYNMVRIIAGTLADVGRGRIKSGDMAEIIASCDRRRAGITAPARGLFLKEVYY